MMATQLVDYGLLAGNEGFRRRRFVRYCACLLLGFVLGLSGLLSVAGSHWYLAHASNPGLRLVGYSQWGEESNCAVVLYGDSSALTGLDPRVIEARTGLKTCNVAEGTVIQNVVGSDLPLQGYLKRNPAPRYILGMWTPSIFHPDQPRCQRYTPEGLTYALNYASPWATLRCFAKNPSWILRFGSDMYEDLRRVLAQRVKRQPQRDVRQERRARDGQWMFPLPPETECVRTHVHFDPETFEWWPESARRFQQKYASAQTRVIVNIAPVPDCDVLYAAYARHDAGIHDNALERLPIRFFNEGDVHFNAEGSRYVSEGAAEQILAAEATRGR